MLLVLLLLLLMVLLLPQHHFEGAGSVRGTATATGVADGSPLDILNYS